MSKYNLYVEDVSVEAVFNILGGVEGAKALLAGELVVSRPARLWREEDGVIYFSLTSNGRTGSAWVKHLEKKGFRLSKYAKDLLLSPDFKPTKGVTYNLAVLRGTFFSDNGRYTKNIHVEAEKRGWAKPNAEVACLIRENFSDEELEAMGLWWIVVIHEPIKDSGGVPCLLGAGRDGEGSWLDTSYDSPGNEWDDRGGFAFLSQE